ncbi:L-asparaginase I [Ostreococcus tauri]|uniref:asparaginase n=1 Tax=Ostreococcus tauri TaxID=70448 RepID=A0A1Y5IGV1_OSTTA|nr:L-asparaginase I [Ostreococcus tauri]
MDAPEKVGFAVGLAPGAIPRPESVENLRRQRSLGLLPGPTKDARPELAPRPRVLMFHCGGTLGMGAESFAEDERCASPRPVPMRGGGKYRALGSNKFLLDVLDVVPELTSLADIEVVVLMNKDSSEMDARDWKALGLALHEKRESYGGFIIAHGTDTMAYTASALSLMLEGFGKPIVLTGSQLPLAYPRSDARQNLLDALTCIVGSKSCGGVVDFYEVAICFNGKLLRGNRAQKTSATVYAAFSSPSYPALARLGVGVDWNHARLLPRQEQYTPRFDVNPNVIRVPVIPGLDIAAAYGDVYERGVRGIVLEAFGVGNFPSSLIPWLTEQTAKGLRVHLSTQCQSGELRPELYAAGLGALAVGARSGPVMTIECSVVKMMLCLANPGFDLDRSVAGETDTVDFCI